MAAETRNEVGATVKTSVFTFVTIISFRSFRILPFSVDGWVGGEQKQMDVPLYFFLNSRAEQKTLIEPLLETAGLGRSVGVAPA